MMLAKARRYEGEERGMGEVGENRSSNMSLRAHHGTFTEKSREGPLPLLSPDPLHFHLPQQKWP
jgi:hypothetical protein